MAQIFATAFVITCFGYAFLAATTTIFYKNQYPENLGTVERDILYGRATIGTRLNAFFFNLLASAIAPPVYIIASLITFIVYVMR